jgi:peptidoglycan/LPS O-acetylase OafA/YrhL
VNIALQRGIESKAAVASCQLRKIHHLDGAVIAVVEKPSLPRILVLDNLRGLSAIYVVLMHTAFASKRTLFVPALLKNFIVFGSTGVFLFFIISGFSLSLTMPRHSATASPAKSYAFARFFRIAPLFYVMLILSLLRDWGLWHFTHSVREIAGNIIFIFNFVPGHQEGIVWASWTIGVEMVYYCLFPFFYRFSLGARALLLVGVTVLHCWCIWIFGGSGILKLSLLGFLPIFLLGEITFQLVSIYHDSLRAKKLAPIAVFCGAAILLYCMGPGRVQPFTTGIVAELLRIVSGLGYSLLLFGLILRPIKIFENRVFSFYGKISYSLYLCHPTIVYLLSRPYQWVFKIVPASLGYVVCACFTLAIATGIASILYQFVEKPFIRLGHRLLQFHTASRESRVAVLSTT